ncbi:unnamed protein product, partial [Owenia fusiformis]
KEISSNVEFAQKCAQKNLEMSREHMRSSTAKNETRIEYVPNQVVFYHYPVKKKFLNFKLTSKHYHGPFLIVRRDGNNYYLKRPDGTKLKTPVHFDEIRPSYQLWANEIKNCEIAQDDDVEKGIQNDENDTNEASESNNENDLKDELFQIDKIWRGRYKNGILEYLIQWKNMTKDECSWEPYDNLNDETKLYLKNHTVRLVGNVPKGIQKKIASFNSI